MSQESQSGYNTASVLSDGLYFKRFSSIYQITSRMNLVRIPISLTLIQGVFRVQDGIPVRKILSTRPVFHKNPRIDLEDSEMLF